MGTRKDLGDLLDLARQAGWVVKYLKGAGHWQLKSPDGKTIIHTGSTPSDPRSVSNFRAQLRRGGLEI